MRRLLLVRHAATPATRTARFPTDEGIGERDLSEASALAGVLPGDCEAMSGPELRCRQTAVAAGFSRPRLDQDLAECDFGRWAGRTLEEVQATDPEAGAAWLADPDASAHGGESLAALAGRVGRWLERQAGQHGPAVAFTHAGVVKAAVVGALGAPLQAFWRLDVSPLAITELRARDGRWTVARVNWSGGPSRGRRS